MNLLELKSLSAEHLSAAVELDKLCFGGLWTFSGYERELDSPNSKLLALEALPSEFPPFSSAPDQREDEALEVKSRKTLTALDKEDNLSKINSQALGHTPSPRPLLGLGCFWSILEEAHITILAVHPDYRRRGLGRLLLYALLREARNHQLERATLEVKPSNQVALSLYHKFGFTEAGRRLKYYKDTGEDALVLWRGGLQTPEFEEMLTNFYRILVPQLASWDWKLRLDSRAEAHQD
ncbi:ribosomal protein S18-alanine N-acetyltransferase [Lyngbya aestuarii]|uniref:ribosomal protein S18-alanine N-acetyltransferase n=1 Tax=Lyngbya aestuarii TaxID=118322 RepID=UPI00403E27FF